MIYSDDGILTVRTYEFYREDDQFEHVVVSHPRKFALEHGIKDEDLTMLMHCDMKVKGWRCRAVDTEIRGFDDA